MGEQAPICLREIVDEVDGRYREDIEDRQLLKAMDGSNIRVLTKNMGAKMGRLICQVEECDAECRSYEYRDGLFLLDPRAGVDIEQEPVTEYDCHKLQSSW